MALSLFLLTLAFTQAINGIHHAGSSTGIQQLLNDSESTVGGIPFATRAYWMRKANKALPDLGSPCPWAAFGSVVTKERRGRVNKTWEIAAITNCTDILTNKHGRFKLTSLEALEAFKEFTLYTNAESCPMCAAAIRWAGFKEYVYGTSMETLIRMGWPQIRISSRGVFEHSTGLPSSSNIIGGILMNETDTYFCMAV
ncbi:conserved hypothetical protein [Histoplasma capsulatum G186AR]|uniref:CMP/dCMP-type deaminase domain-containing protein n=2 Tax=Ajellomyces capsulatus TaxID=5037 RepID=C0NQ26_AJECG|nr:uncharacterized protein HCBG_05256 [Histoplasma capsulatum G186AR]EEH07036.1 conserved hypothetical protein [Histoplasma capsulatum G186AR]